MTALDRPFWAVFLSIAIIGAFTWLAIFEHNYLPRIYRYNGDVTILGERASWTSTIRKERSASGGRVEERI